MGIGIRIFLVDDNDSIKRFPATRFERLIRRDPEERLSQYAGKRVRFVEIALDFEQRKPVNVIRIQPFILSFDSEGRINKDDQEKEQRLTAEVISIPLIKQESNNVIDAQHHFVRKHLDHRYRWTPTAEIEKTILDMIFGTDPNK